MIAISSKQTSRRINQLGLNLQNRRALGALTLLPFPKDGLFAVQDIVDAQNRLVVEYSNASRGGRKDLLQNWDTLRGGALPQD